jgi:hypothetical protein
MTVELHTLLGMTKDETRAMYALEHWLIRLDIKDTGDKEVANKKTNWIGKWENIIFEKSFFGLISEKPPISEFEVIKKLKDTITDENKRLLVFSEALVFTPYFNIQVKNSTHLPEEKTEYVKDRERWETNLFQLATKVGLQKSDLLNWKNAYQKALEAIAGRSEILGKVALVALASVAIGVTGGVAAPALGGIIGGMMGLSGAAATSAGLAFLGGGAIAAGGFGMAGGSIAVIGGGAILGGVGGWAASRRFFLQHKLVLSQLAKLEATLRIITKNDPENINSVVLSQVKTLKELRKEHSTPNLDESEKKSLKKTIEYYERSIERLNEILIKL